MGPQVCFHEAPLLAPTLPDNRGRHDGSSEMAEKEEGDLGSGPSGQKQDVGSCLLVGRAIVFPSLLTG